MRIISLIFVFCGIFLHDSYCQNQDTTIYIIVDSLPNFEYKDGKNLNESVNLYLSERLIWPSDIDVVGKVYIQLVVEKDGSLTNFKIFRGLEEKFDEASIEGLKNMPKWEPGKIKDKIVRTQVIVPVTWALN